MAASARNNMFIAYDRDFRKLHAHNNMPWDVIHQELYLALSYRNQNVSHNPRHTQGNNGKQSSRGWGGGGGVCYAFASSGRCLRNNCPYSHACSKCGGNHHLKFQCIQSNKTLSLLNLPTPVIVGNLQLMWSDMIMKYHRISSTSLVVGLKFRFVDLWTMLIIHLTTRRYLINLFMFSR